MILLQKIFDKHQILSFYCNLLMDIVLSYEALKKVERLKSNKSSVYVLIK